MIVMKTYLFGCVKVAMESEVKHSYLVTIFKKLKYERVGAISILHISGFPIYQRVGNIKNILNKFTWESNAKLA